jgi:serine/threonine protein kinase/Tol biopolymer transport system component
VLSARWQEMKSVLHRALQLHGQERSAFLGRVCTSDSIRQELESLLSSSDEVRSSFLQSDTVDAILAPGTKVGDYEVVAFIDAGGMGKIYRAHDPRLRRDVAIKVLPAYVKNDPDRLRRFEQEAQAAAALNHPNILAIYQMGIYEGTSYLVSELLEGTTLRDAMRRGPLPTREAIQYAMQIAQGLAAAHEKGIIHRDLKPENLFVTKDGRVKILDFGLAKLTQALTWSKREPAMNREETLPGLVMGTLGYMSPEQVCGERTDGRADIFAFGVVLYEMLSGRRAFHKPTPADSIRAILDEDPPPLSHFVPTTPTWLQKLVERCLEKNPQRRFQSASDLLQALDGLSLTKDAAVEQDTNLQGFLAPVAVPSSKWSATPVYLVLALVAASIAVIAMLFFVQRNRPAPAPVKPRALTRLTFDDGLQIGATWSPDSRFIAYSSDRNGKFDIWLQLLSGGDPVQITKGPGANWQPDWSPDGNYIAYRSEKEGGLFIIPALGGEESKRRISSFGYWPRWSPDGSQILFRAHFSDQLDVMDQFYVVGLDGNPPHEILPSFFAQHNPLAVTWHPDGKRVSVWVADASPSPAIWTVPIAGGPGIKSEIAPAVDKELGGLSPTNDLNNPTDFTTFSWARSGNAIYFDRLYRGARNIWKMTIEPDTLRVIAVERLTTGAGADAVSALSFNGKRLAFTTKSEHIRSWLFPFDATVGRVTGSGQAITSPGGWAFEHSLSRDGKRLAFRLSRAGQDWELREKSLVDGREAPVIRDNYERQYPQWSPDGEALAYWRVSHPNGTKLGQLVRWQLKTRSEEPLTSVNPKTGIVYDWSPDGKELLVSQTSGEAIHPHIEVWLYPLAAAPHAESQARRLISKPACALFEPHFSPDARWIAFEVMSNSANAADSRLYVMPAGGGAWTPLTDGTHWDDKPRWSPDGKKIYFISGHGGFFNVWGIRFDPRRGVPIGVAFPVTNFASPRLMVPQSIEPVGFALTQDRLVLTMEDVSGGIWVLDGVDQ